MSAPETPRTPPPALRLAAASPALPEPDPLPQPLAVFLEALAPAALDAATAAQILAQRLGDARTLALLAQGDTARGAGALAALALRACGKVLARSLAEQPEDASGRLAIVRASGALRFGKVLVAQGLVAPRRLEAALAAQQASGRRVGEELVAEGQIAPREVAEALWLQHKLLAATLALFTAEATRVVSSPRLVHSR